jgi:hypothetical protein
VLGEDVALGDEVGATVLHVVGVSAARTTMSKPGPVGLEDQLARALAVPWA